MCVGIDDAGHDGLARGVDAGRSGRNRHPASRSNRLDTVTRHHDHAAFDDGAAAGAGHGDDAGADERDLTGGDVAVLREADVHACRLGRRGHLLSAFDECERLRQVAREQFRSQCPVHAPAVGRPVQREAGIARDLGNGIRGAARCNRRRSSGGRQRHDVGAEALLERHPLVVGRRDDLQRIVGLHVHDLVGAVERDAAQYRLLGAPVAQEDARAVTVEERLLAAIGHLPGRAAGGGDDEHAGIGGVGDVAVGIGTCRTVDDRCAIR